MPHVPGYRLIDELGSGGMREVWRAERLSDQQLVVLKICHNHLAKQDDFIRRYHREAEAASRLDHPNAVRIFAEDTTPDARPYLVMELVEGTKLADLIRQPGKLDADEIVLITRGIAHALEAAHTLGLIHRDIKPDNVVLPAEAVRARVTQKASLVRTLSVAGGGASAPIKLLDFGLVKKLASQSTVLMLTNSAVATPAYMSPEQCARRDVDARGGASTPGA